MIQLNEQGYKSNRDAQVRAAMQFGLFVRLRMGILARVFWAIYAGLASK